MARDHLLVRAKDVSVLAGLVGLSVPDEDLEPLAEALTMHLAFTSQMADVDVRAVPSTVTFDPRWRV
jgi:Asp-tRNA(Asn)/Glu-tRNA(Gln) amidotransferase C subunit